ncbi:MAG: c-type cytochrome [Stellaceae bacterium]
MAVNAPPTPRSIDRSWRLWASVAILGFVAVSLLLGFIVIPLGQRGETGLGTFAAICRAIGVPAIGAAAPRVAPAPTTSQFAWSPATMKLFASADPREGAAFAADNCSACHGEKGIGPDPQFPNLAGEPAAAILKQLLDYRSHARVSDIMTPIIGSVPEAQLPNLAAFYAGLAPDARATARNAVMTEIRQIAEAGDPSRAIAACDVCHGPNRGAGPAETPLLIGQSGDYITLQLQSFAAGERRNDAFGRMRTIARALSTAEIKALAVYYHGAPK